MGYKSTDKKSKLVTRLKRLTGQINGIEKMINEERACTDVIVQIQAVRAALASIGQELIKDEAIFCVDNQHNTVEVEKLQELVKNLFKLS